MIDEKILTEEIESLSVNITGLRAGKGILRQFMKHYQKSVLRIIDEQPKIREWIPLTENDKLPSIGKDVLVTTWSGEVLVGTWWGSRWSTAYRHSEEVVAWMPKPEGYIQ